MSKVSKVSNIVTFPKIASEDEKMKKQYEYRVCAMQNGRITFVNGQWQGTIAPGTDDPNEALNTCPVVWRYLQEAGEHGWELVSAVNQPLEDVQLQTLFMMRESSGLAENDAMQDSG